MGMISARSCHNSHFKGISIGQGLGCSSFLELCSASSPMVRPGAGTAGGFDAIQVSENSRALMEQCAVRTTQARFH